MPLFTMEWEWKSFRLKIIRMLSISKISSWFFDFWKYEHSYPYNLNMTGKGDPAVPRQQWPQCGGGKCDFVNLKEGNPAFSKQQWPRWEDGKCVFVTIKHTSPAKMLFKTQIKLEDRTSSHETIWTRDDNHVEDSEENEDRQLEFAACKGRDTHSE